MKKLFILLAAALPMLGQATQYCHTAVVNDIDGVAGDETIYLTLTNPSENLYRIQLDAAGNDAFTQLGGVFAYINGDEGYAFTGEGDVKHYTVSTDRYTLVAEVESTTPVNVYTGIFVGLEGKGNLHFAWPTDIDWVADCGAEVFDVTRNVARYKTTTPEANITEANGGRWQADGTDLDKQVITIDLGEVYHLTTVQISWEAAYATNFDLQVATVANPTDADFRTARTIAQTGIATETLLTYAIDANARHLRIRANALALGYGMCIYNVRAYADAINPAAEDAPVLNKAELNGDVIEVEATAGARALKTFRVSERDARFSSFIAYTEDGTIALPELAGSCESYKVEVRAINADGVESGERLVVVEALPDFTKNLVAGKNTADGTAGANIAKEGTAVENAFDGNEGSVWSTWGAAGEDGLTELYIWFDLGAEYELDNIVINWTNAWAQNFAIQRADAVDGEWETIIDAEGQDSQKLTYDLSTAVRRYARFVRIYAVPAECPFGNAMNIREIEVYAKDCAPALSDDAFLKSLTVSEGTLSPAFTATNLVYNVELAASVTDVPTVEAVANDENAEVVIKPAEDLTGTTLVIVTAQNGRDQLTYRVSFSVLTTLAETVDNNTVLANVRLFNIAGQQVALFENMTLGEVREQVRNTQPMGIYMIHTNMGVEKLINK